jgi:pimeloyl-ACP methyl ester carboxylesterase
LLGSGDNLFELVKGHVSQSVLLVAHSRGGLVAARAAQKLAKDGQGRFDRSCEYCYVGIAGGTPVGVAAELAVDAITLY